MNRRAILVPLLVATLLVLAPFSTVHAEELLRTQERGQITQWTRLVSFRFAAGANLALGTNESFATAADVAAGVRLYAPMGPPRLVLLPDIGYSYAGNASSPTHLLTAGIGFGIGAMELGAVGVAWTPRIVLSPTDSSAVGVRNGFLVDIAALATLELSHQYLPVDSKDAHSLRIVFGFDFGIALQALTSHRNR